MANSELDVLAGALKNKGLPEAYIINRLKEYLQLRILNYLYNHKSYNRKLIFTGGTCLRFCFGLPRLSENLDFDFEGDLDAGVMGRDVARHLNGLLKAKDIICAIKGGNEKIYLKLPVLDKLGLSFGGSRILYLKIEPAAAPKAPADIEVASVSKDGFYFFIRRYSLPDLMAGKINAFLTRLYFKGKGGEIDFKGRDVFDLIWYMSRNIQPSRERLQILLAGTGYEKRGWPGLLDDIGKKLKNIKKPHITGDIRYFIEDQNALRAFLSNYLAVFSQYRRDSFSLDSAR